MSRSTDEKTATDLRTGAAGLTPALDFDAIGLAVGATAEREGLAEIAWTVTETPIGRLLLAATDAGLVRVGWAGDDRDAMLEQLATSIGPRIVELPSRLDPARRQLDEYFEGRRRGFDLDLDWRLSAGFVRAVLRACNEIPFGETRSYSEMAVAAGSPRAFRAAGSALGANPIPVIVPCHRVLRTGGALGGYGGGLDAKRRLLELEGVLD